MEVMQLVMAAAAQAAMVMAEAVMTAVEFPVPSQAVLTAVDPQAVLTAVDSQAVDSQAVLPRRETQDVVQGPRRRESHAARPKKLCKALAAPPTAPAHAAVVALAAALPVAAVAATTANL